MPSDWLTYQGVMGFAGRARQKNDGIVARHHRPELAADAFALGVPVDRELGQVGRDRRRADDRRAAIVLLDVGARRRASSKKSSRSALPNAESNSARSRAWSSPRSPRARDARAAADQRAGAVDGEQLAQQLQRVDDRDAHAVGHLFQQRLDLADQRRLPPRQCVAVDRGRRSRSPRLTTERGGRAAAGRGRRRRLRKISLRVSSAGGQRAEHARSARRRDALAASSDTSGIAPARDRRAHRRESVVG